ncbi:hypothetical protein [Tepidibacter sp. Z1-5]|uniref:hypothetical protein n=1 Tax=Tepidibacter sp. Z1-5 TaxID=3134138 RepID=UPI0030BF48AF
MISLYSLIDIIIPFVVFIWIIYGTILTRREKKPIYIIGIMSSISIGLFAIILERLMDVYFVNYRPYKDLFFYINAVMVILLIVSMHIAIFKTEDKQAKKIGIFFCISIWVYIFLYVL